MENLEIINTVRAMVMDKDQIMAFLAICRAAMRKQPKPMLSDNAKTEVTRP